ncbi:Matrixin [Singulisphaera sp. GP187]|uniref:matrixin family metalloprotease n=1 Tax=Singulisphaera sp. GP187 TaxID=1882752 RepID=UPI00092A13CD|nr:matrixin family metalloprotease [Singulisphaera sp. GP187]SIN74463.1 Matrixin [Singulisphaera sp. GP187]
MLQLRHWSKSHEEGGRGKSSRRRRLEWDCLEERMLLATAGYDYVLNGTRWADPSHITYSVAPDGVLWDHGPSNLNATFNAKFGNGVWQRQIALALATWESVANINIAQVADSALGFGIYGKPQGDPRFGDIRVSGSSFYNRDTPTLAIGYYPPPQGTTEAGDVEVNTTKNFTIGGAGGSYDLYSVLLHETGHALGLDHSLNPKAVMYASYQGVQAGLQPEDIAGIQAIYGARVADPYQAQGLGQGWTSAIDVTAGLGSARQTTVGNVSLATIGATEYFTVIAPNTPGATLQVTAAAGNVSLLSPKLSVFDASGNLLGAAANPSAWSNNVSVNTAQLVPGQRYYITVTGATRDALAVGAYQLQVAFTGGNPPSQVTPPSGTVSPPSGTIIAPPTTGPVSTVGPDRFEPNNTSALATNLGIVVNSVTVGNLTLDTAGDVDTFVLRNGKAGIYRILAGGAAIRVFDRFGNPLASDVGELSIRVFKPRTPLYVQISSATGTGNENYSLIVSAQKGKGAVTPPVKVRRPVLRQGAHRLV